MKVYISNSIFGKKVEVVEPGKDDKFDSIVICPHCGKQVNFGNDLYLISGHSCCTYCQNDLWKEIEKDKADDYDNYCNKDYEPYGVDDLTDYVCWEEWRRMNND